MPRGKHGNHCRGADHYRWNGGRSISSHGYVKVQVGNLHHLADPNGYAYEHQIVAEESLGRRLLPGEVVHHVDGDTQNNAPENLQVLPVGDHHRHHNQTTRIRDTRTGRFVSRTPKAGGRELDGRTWDEMPAVAS